jgi:hypothetical protein
MISEVWKNLKLGKTLYLSAREKTLLYEYLKGLTDNEQRIYYSNHFKFSIDPDDRERTTYECFCNDTFENFYAKRIKIYGLGILDTPELGVESPEELPEESDSHIYTKLEQALAMIQSIEEIMGVSVLARGGAYGSARLVLRDVNTGKEIERN